ncbi:phage tail sheath family protein [Lachnoclostridium phytofermentans]|uniref:Phage protein n=1 Tax=Lachnoclostridium phytofermentans (strain ATCC 700394 / DSM 18823 / ISDg) TaxID=357809 RepID=A9KQ03_LACP7|nr:phage tail sheath family protein [Lachnoclostridium phytofermentans]ABX43315.1 phage protein [Lachnoclostridium phytofermentans ISDg]
MSLGGGTFVTQNKVLPGAYINFISAISASESLTDRGIAAIGLDLNWGIDGEIFEVTNADFKEESLRIFGYEYTDAKMKGLRDLFLNAKMLYAYKLTSNGEKATNEYATAKHSGTRGNDLKIVISLNADEPDNFDVKTYLGTLIVDAQTVATADKLVANDFVKFKSDAVLTVTAGTALSNGSNGVIDGASHTAFLAKAESYSFNAIGVISTDDEVNGLYAAYAKRMRDELGVKFQAVTYHKAYDYEGVVNVKNKVINAGWSEASLVYWVTGIIAGCEVNKSNLNKSYNGEFTIDTNYTQSQLEAAIKAGEFTLHKVGPNVRVLADINSMVTISDTKSDIFKENQTIRVIDQIANDIAVLFNTKYLGAIPNDASGRISLWSDVVKHHKALQNIRAIENFQDSDVVITQGATKKSVVVSDVVTVVNAMGQLYMTVTVQ